MSMIRYYHTECKLLLRGPGFYMMFFSMVATIYVMLRGTDIRLDRAEYVLDISVVYCSIVIIMLPLLATAIARRDEEWKTAAMMASFPYRTWEMETARLLSALTLPFIAALIPMGVYTWMIIQDGISWGGREWYTSAVLASFAIPMLCATTVAYFVGILFRKRYSYIISFFLLLTISIMLPEFFRTERPAFSLPPHIQIWFDYSLIKNISTMYSHMWGFTYEASFWLHRGMVAMIAIGMMIAVLLIVFRRRRERMRIWFFCPVLLILGGSLFWAGSTMHEHLQERVDIAAANERFYAERLTSANSINKQRELEQLFVTEVASGKYKEEDIEELSRVTINSEESTIHPLSVSHMKDLLVGMKYQDININSYQLEMELLPQHHLAIQAKMEVSNGQAESIEKFPIMLRHIFEVQKVQLNGTDAAFEWEKDADVMWITPSTSIIPEEKLVIEMTYSATVNDWRRYYSSAESRDRWEQIAFVENSRLFLPAFYGWYPVIGNDRLSELLTEHYEWGRHTANILDTQLPRAMASFDIKVTGESGLELFSNAPVISIEKAEKKGMTITHLKLDEASGLTLFGGDLQLAEATVEGKTYRLLASAQLPTRSIELAAQLSAEHYAEVVRTLERLDGEAVTNFPQTVTMALSDYPFYNLNESSLRTRGMVDAAMGGPEARDIHYLYQGSKYRYFGAEVEQRKDGQIHLNSAQYWLDYSAKRRESSNGRLSYFNAQFILNHLFQTYIEQRVKNEEIIAPQFQEGNYFWNGSNQVYELMNTIYDQYGIVGGYEVIKLLYNSIGTEQIFEDSDEEIEALLADYLQRKLEGKQ